jgi:hypothetical protein
MLYSRVEGWMPARIVLIVAVPEGWSADGPEPPRWPLLNGGDSRDTTTLQQLSAEREAVCGLCMCQLLISLK